MEYSSDTGVTINYAKDKIIWNFLSKVGEKIASFITIILTVGVKLAWHGGSGRGRGGGFVSKWIPESA